VDTPPPDRRFPEDAARDLGGGESGKRSESQSVRCAHQLCVPPPHGSLNNGMVNRVARLTHHPYAPRTRSQGPEKRVRTPEHESRTEQEANRAAQAPQSTTMH